MMNDYSNEERILGGCCGRHFPTAPENKCKYNDCCMNEYAYKQKACIRNKQPDCEAQAVIPSITVETVDGITNLANCFVHVTSINTTFYIDDKHRIMITWAGPVNMPGYDMETNPERFRDQIVTDTEAGLAVIYDAKGVGYTFGIEQGLDVTEAVNNKIDEMAEDGTLAEIVEQYLNDKIVYAFDTVAGMKVSTDLANGSYAKTLGFYSSDDGGGALYKIRNINGGDVTDDMFIIAMSNPGLVAELVIEDKLHSKQLGLKGDGATDETSKLNKLLDNNYNVNIVIDNGVYLTSGIVFIKGLWRQSSGNNGHRNITFNNATIKYNGPVNGAAVVLYNMFKTSVDGLCVARDSVDNHVTIIGCWHTSFDNWDVREVIITNDNTELDGRSVSSTGCEYISFDNLFVLKTLYINAVSGSWINEVNFFNSLIGSNNIAHDYCVVLNGATSKQNINFYNTDLSYGETSIFHVPEAQTGHGIVNCLGCYFDSGVLIFSNNSKNGLMFNNMFPMMPAMSNSEIVNIKFTDFIKNMNMMGYGQHGWNLPIANVNLAINGNIESTSTLANQYSSLFGPNSSTWTKTYGVSNRSISGNSRILTAVENETKNRAIRIDSIAAPRTDNYTFFARMKILSGSCESIQNNFNGGYVTYYPSQFGNDEFVFINSKFDTTPISENASLQSEILFVNSTSDFSVEFYEVGVVEGKTYIPNMPLHNSAKISVS